MRRRASPRRDRRARRRCRRPSAGTGPADGATARRTARNRDAGRPGRTPRDPGPHGRGSPSAAPPGRTRPRSRKAAAMESVPSSLMMRAARATHPPPSATSPTTTFWVPSQSAASAAARRSPAVEQGPVGALPDREVVRAVAPGDGRDGEPVVVLGSERRLGLRGGERVIGALPGSVGVRRPRLVEGHSLSIVLGSASGLGRERQGQHRGRAGRPDRAGGEGQRPAGDDLVVDEEDPRAVGRRRPGASSGARRRRPAGRSWPRPGPARRRGRRSPSGPTTGTWSRRDSPPARSSVRVGRVDRLDDHDRVDLGAPVVEQREHGRARPSGTGPSGVSGRNRARSCLRRGRGRSAGRRRGPPRRPRRSCP